MYEQYYSLIEPPFSLTPDPKYFYRSESHHRAFELLHYAIQRREGFMIVYGDIGTGKTTLCRAVLDTIEKNVYTALLLNPFLHELDLMKTILADFSVPVPNSTSTQDLLNALNKFLISVLEKEGRARESPSRLYVLPSYLAKTSMWSLSSISFTSKRSGDFELRRIE